MKTFIVDAFTHIPFKGNPAAVCFPDNALSDEQMLDLAKEFGLSETAFVQATGKTGVYAIRYFSPKKEIPLCGHATLATAKVLFRDAGISALHFITIEKTDLFIQRRQDDIIMEFPVFDTVPATATPELLHALGLRIISNAVLSPKNNILVLEISDAAVLAALQPDFTALVNAYSDISGVLVTAPAGNLEYDFHYRYFWPWSGTNEDPVTGGVQTFLAKYWSAKLGKQKMKAFQSSARTGYMDLELHDNKVLLISQAVVVLEGNTFIFD